MDVLGFAHDTGVEGESRFNDIVLLVPGNVVVTRDAKTNEAILRAKSDRLDIKATLHFSDSLLAQGTRAILFGDPVSDAALAEHVLAGVNVSLLRLLNVR